MDSSTYDKVDVHNIFRGMGHDGALGMGGLGGGLLGGVLAGALFNNRRGGFLGGGDCDGSGGAENRIEDTVFNTATLTKLGAIEAAIPLSALQTQNATASAIAQLALGTQQGFATVKDSVQALALFTSNQINNVNQNVSDQGCKTREVVQAGTTAVLSAISASTIAELQAQLADARHHGRSRETEFNVTQNTNVAVAQAQQQQQQQQLNSTLNAVLNSLGCLTQVAHATNQNIIAGNTGAVATGAQTANPTNIRA